MFLRGWVVIAKQNQGFHQNSDGNPCKGKQQLEINASNQLELPWLQRCRNLAKGGRIEVGHASDVGQPQGGIGLAEVRVIEDIEGIDTKLHI